jgi:broad specificity phosphatase PhoE
MNNKYFLLRHGQTVYQTKKEGLIYPWPEKREVKLTKAGKEMIKSIAKTLKDKKIEAIFSSPFYRTRQTAEIVSKTLGIKPKFDKRLIDVNFGVYSSGPAENFYKDFSDSKTRFLKRPKKGESRKDIKKRLMSFLGDVERKYKNKNILIVSHGDPIMLLEGIIKGLKTDEEFIEYLSKAKIPEVGELKKIKKQKSRIKNQKSCLPACRQAGRQAKIKT